MSGGILAPKENLNTNNRAKHGIEAEALNKIPYRLAIFDTNKGGTNL